MVTLLEVGLLSVTATIITECYIDQIKVQEPSPMLSSVEVLELSSLMMSDVLELRQDYSVVLETLLVLITVSMQRMQESDVIHHQVRVIPSKSKKKQQPKKPFISWSDCN